ncbi:MAG: chemotaxis protein CheD [Planctomycetes bacterium]|nr:chemotaxis protein CheD [Planctomycetota bacterium]
MKLTTKPDDLLITHSLGSCLGIIVYDPKASVGALLHVMLPLSTINPAKAADNPYMFVDTGVPKLLNECYKMGAKKGSLMIKVAGGAKIGAAAQKGDFFAIGSRNVTVFRKVLWKNGLMCKSADVGGTRPRTMSLDMTTGEVLIRSNGDVAAL